MDICGPFCFRAASAPPILSPHIRPGRERTMSSALEDKDAIRELLADYCYKLDAGQKEAMAALFTPDGTWETAFGTGMHMPAKLQYHLLSGHWRLV